MAVAGAPGRIGNPQIRRLLGIEQADEIMNRWPVLCRMEVVAVHKRPAYRIENIVMYIIPGEPLNLSLFLPGRIRPPFPGLLIYPGGRSKADLPIQYIVQGLVRHGYAVALADRRLTGERQHRQEAAAGMTALWHEVREGLCQADFISSRKDIDSSRIGCLGIEEGFLPAVIHRALTASGSRGMACMAAVLPDPAPDQDGMALLADEEGSCQVFSNENAADGPLGGSVIRKALYAYLDAILKPENPDRFQDVLEGEVDFRERPGTLHFLTERHLENSISPIPAQGQPW
jgi:hypothetical protein